MQWLCKSQVVVIVERLLINSGIPDFSLLLSKVTPKCFVTIQTSGGKGSMVIGRGFYNRNLYDIPVSYILFSVNDPAS
jgi:hypothetical protein